MELLFFVIARFPLVTGFIISNENRQTARTLRISRKTLSRFTEDKVSPVARKTQGNFLTLFRLYYICIYSNVEFDPSRYLLESCGVFCFVWCRVLYAFATGVGVRFKEKDISHRVSLNIHTPERADKKVAVSVAVALSKTLGIFLSSVRLYYSYSNVEFDPSR